MTVRTPSVYGLPLDQKLGFLTVLKWSPWTHSTNLNGPVPLALVLASGPSMMFLSTMFRRSKKSNTSGRACSEFRMMVFLSGVSNELNQLLWLTNAPAPTLGSRTRRKLYLTSSLVNSRPPWKVTPSRRLTLIGLETLLMPQHSPTLGCGSTS